MAKKVTRAVLKMRERRRNRAEKRGRLDAWKLAVKTRDRFKCQVCNNGETLVGRQCHAHHIIPSTFENLCTDEINGITLCYKHHVMGKFAAHKNALWFSEWLKKNKPKAYEYLMSFLEENGYL